MLQQLSKSEEFLALPLPQQQIVLAQYMQAMQQQAAVANPPSVNLWVEIDNN